MLAQKNGLSGTALKTIALVLMLLDHIHYFFAFTGAVPTLFSMLGRLSAPLFLFCTVEGFAHTRDRKRYFLRIWAIGAGMAAVQFFMMYGGDAAPGRWLLPAERDLSELEPALCPVAGDGLAAGQALSPGGGGHFGGPAVALCGGGAADGFSPDLPASGRLIGGGLSHHQSAAHVVRHHGRRMELFAGGRAAVPAAQPPDPSGRRLGAEQLNVSCSACWRRWGG